MASNDANFTGSIPQHYDQGMGPMIFVDFAAELARRVAARKPKRVLETAAGTGIVTSALRDALPVEVKLTATDLNPPMLEVARTKFGAGAQVAFQPADAQSLPFGDESFDAVVCQFGLMFFPDKEKSYREALRVLAPGGHYLFSVWDSHRYNPYGRIAHEIAVRTFPQDPPQFYNVPFSLHQIDPIKEGLLKAGFTDIAIAVVTLDKEVPDAGAFARGFVYGNPMIEQIRARGGDPDKVAAMMTAEYEREFGKSPGRMPLQAIFFDAKKK